MPTVGTSGRMCRRAHTSRLCSRVPLFPLSVIIIIIIIIIIAFVGDRLCGLVVRVPGYRSRGPEFDSRRYQIF
jgi:hypothetical protein